MNLSAVALILALLGAPLTAEGQQAGKVARIGVLRVESIPPAFIDGFRQGLRELGYVEGQNITIEYGLAQNVAQLPNVAAQLVRLKVDVLVASGIPSLLPAMNATSTIPVVFVVALDPVAAGLIPSLGRPGGNVTGVAIMHEALTGKRMELLKELLPTLSRIAILVRPTSPAATQYVREAEIAARALRIPLQVLTVREPDDLEGALSKARGALILSDDAVFTAHRAHIAALALKHRLLLVSGIRDVAEAGALMAYGADNRESYRRAATFIDKILKGAKPGDLPVEQPTRFQLVINLKTAKALGLTIPQSLLLRADEVIQ